MSTKNQHYSPAWGALVIGLLLSVLLSFQVKQGIEDTAAREFSTSCDQIVFKVRERLDAYALVLRGGAGLFAASKDVGRHEWRSYVETQRASETVPGVQGIGFAQLIPPHQLAEHIARIRGQGFPDYSVRPPGERPIYTSIIFLEPFRDRNLRAFGYDMLSEPVRRAAMERARDTGEAALSGKVELVQETATDVQAGTLMYFPVYRKGAAAETIRQRREALIGWVYSPYRMNDLMSGILADWTRHEGKSIALQIFAGREASTTGVLFNSQPNTTPVVNALFHQQRTIGFNGNHWLLVFNGTHVISGMNYMPAWAILLIGCVLSGLLFRRLDSASSRLREETQRRKQETAILGSQLDLLNQRFSLAADSARIGVWDYHVPENRLIWDHWMFALYGLQEKDFSGAYQAWQNGLHPDDKLRGDEEIRQALCGEKNFDTEFRVLWPNGEVRYLKATALVLRDAEGKPLRMIGVNYDISERRKNEAALKSSEANFRTFFSSIADLLFVLDGNANMLEMNETVLRRLEYTKEELIGQSVLMIHPEARRAEAGAVVAEMLAGTRDFCPVPVLSKSGVEIQVETRVYPGIWNGQPALFGVVKDVTKIKQSEEKFIRAFQSGTNLMAISSGNTGVYLDVNDMFLQLLEYSKDEVIGRTSRELSIFVDPQQHGFIKSLMVEQGFVRDLVF